MKDKLKLIFTYSVLVFSLILYYFYRITNGVLLPHKPIMKYRVWLKMTDQIKMDSALFLTMIILVTAYKLGSIKLFLIVLLIVAIPNIFIALKHIVYGRK